MGFDAYKKEKAVLDHAEAILVKPDGVDFKEEFQAMYNSYAKLYRLLRRLVSISDRMEKHLKDANQTIDQQRKELAEAHDDLSIRNLQLETKMSEFEAIFNNSAMGIALLDPDGSFDRINQRLCELLEETPKTLKQRKLNDYLLDYGSDQEEGGGLGCPNPGEILQMERRVKTGGGRVFIAELSGKSLNPTQKEGGVIWLIDDITSRKELQRLQEDVQRIMQHDLKGPLNGIINLPGIIAEEDNLTTQQIELLELIASAGRKMLKQIELSRDIYRMETGNYTFCPHPVDMVTVVHKAMQEFQVMATKLGVDLVALFCGREMTPKDRLVAAVDELLSCVMLGNIVKNALEASRPSETVSISLEQGEHISLTVHNPKPVPAHILPVFFNKYVTSGKEGGTGLGTYSAYLMAKTQLCDMKVVSDAIRGTSVTFTIPRY